MQTQHVRSHQLPRWSYVHEALMTLTHRRCRSQRAPTNRLIGALDKRQPRLADIAGTRIDSKAFTADETGCDA
jgi:hypothetical protein